MLHLRSNKINPPKQKGAALLLFVLLLVVGASTLLVSKLNKSATQYYRDDVTMKALAKAKEALIGYAVSYPDNPTTTNINAGPGYLPCPDVSDPPNGSPTPCAPNTIGRLPWEFIGLDEIRDSSGEHLWYVISDDYRNNPTKHFPLNSETVGGLTIDGNTDIVAILIAPGFSLTGQNRPSITPSDYLEDDNNNGDNSFVSIASVDFNDQILVITRQELMAAVEKRVMGDVSQVLTHYRNNFGGTTSYPWLSKFRNPRVYLPSIPVKDQGLISGSISTDSNSVLADTTKNFGLLNIKSGDVFYNQTTNSMGFITTDAINEDSSLTIESFSPEAPIEMNINDQYRISSFNGETLPGKTTNQGLLPIHYENEAFRTGYEIEWTSMSGDLETVCSQIEHPILHIDALTNSMRDQTSALTIHANKNACVWNGEHSVNCTGFIEEPITFVGSGIPLTISPKLCDPANSTLYPASDITKRRYVFRLNFTAETASVFSYNTSKARDLTTTFNQPKPIGPETELLIQDLNSSDEVLGEARLLTPKTGSFLSVKNIHMDLAPLGGIVSSGSPTSLTDDGKDFISRGVALGQWVENTTDGSRGKITAVTTTTLTLTSLTNGTSNTFSPNDFYQIYNELPKWFTYNNWHHLNYVAFSSENEPEKSGLCDSSNCIKLADSLGVISPNNDNKQAIIISAGQEISNPSSFTQNREIGALTDYFENGNSDSDLTTFDLGNFNPTLSTFNDQIKRVAPCPTPNEIDNCY